MGRHDARDLGLAIKQLCDITGISWNKLSRRSGISKRSLNRYVKGEVMPTPQTLTRIAAVFSVPAGIFDGFAPRCRASRLDVEEILSAGEGTPELAERIGSAALAAMAPFLQQLDQLERWSFCPRSRPVPIHPKSWTASACAGCRGGSGRASGASRTLLKPWPGCATTSMPRRSPTTTP